jgi:hypothetical protein
MSYGLRPQHVGLTLCFGVACGTVQAKRHSATAATSLTPALSPDGGEGEESRRLRAGDSKSQARAFPKWNPLWWFGNADDPEPPDWYRPGSRCRNELWQLRNPLHNFTFYVIGVADKDLTRTGKFPGAVFAPEGGWNWASAKHKWLRLPFVSFNGERWRFYLGWRERGNFGGKINFGKLPSSRDL